MASPAFRSCEWAVAAPRRSALVPAVALGAAAALLLQCPASFTGSGPRAGPAARGGSLRAHDGAPQPLRFGLSGAEVLRQQRRFVCLDFETNGFEDKGPVRGGGKPLPFANFPTQVALVAVEGTEVRPLWQSLISGAEGLADWVVENTPVTVARLATAPPFPEVVRRLRGTLRDGDVIVCHNNDFDMGMVLPRAAKWQGLCVADIMAYPRFCTMKCAYARRVFGDKWPKLQNLCDHFGVALLDAHDAMGDAFALAKCVAEARRRGVMLPAAMGGQVPERSQRDLQFLPTVVQ